MANKLPKKLCNFFLLFVLLLGVFLSYHIYTAKANTDTPTINLMWEKTWGTELFSETARGIAVGDNAIYLVGEIRIIIDEHSTAGYQGGFLIKYDFDGNLLWEKIQEDYYLNCITLGTNAIYAAGHTLRRVGDYSADVFLVKYDLDGNTIWNKTEGFFYYTGDISVGTNAVYVVGLKNLEGFLVKYDLNGNQIWNRTWDYPSGDLTSRYSVTVKNGKVYVAGSDGAEITSPTAGDALLLTYDEDGNQLWAKTWHEYRELAYDVAVGSNSVYVVGDIEGDASRPWKSFILKYDLDGNLLWAKILEEYHNKCVETTDYAVYVAGYANHPNYWDSFLLKYDLDGNQLWEKNWGGGDGEEFVHGIAVKENTMYIAGGSSSFKPSWSDSDVFFLKYVEAQTISCELSSSSIVKNSSISVSGNIGLPISGKTITLTYIKPDGSILNRTVTSDFDGSYSDTFTPETEGSWIVKASCKDDSINLVISSSSVSFTVKEKSGCLIATATYESELSPQVWFLRDFRDNTVLNTFAGSNFMTIFNGFYYSFSPTVASTISSSEGLRGIMKFILYPLIGILQLSSVVFSLFRFSPELGVVIAGFVASLLIAIVYVVPWVLLICFLKKFKPSSKIIRMVGLLWAGSVVSIALAEAATSSLLMMASTGIFILTTICLTTLTAVMGMMKHYIH